MAASSRCACHLVESARVRSRRYLTPLPVRSRSALESAGSSNSQPLIIYRPCYKMMAASSPCACHLVESARVRSRRSLTPLPVRSRSALESAGSSNSQLLKFSATDYLSPPLQDDGSILPLCLPPVQAVYEEGILVEGNAPHRRAEATTGPDTGAHNKPIYALGKRPSVRYSMRPHYTSP